MAQKYALVLCEDARAHSWRNPLPSMQWFQEHCRAHGISMSPRRPDDEHADAIADQGGDATSQVSTCILIVEAGTCCEGVLTPWHEQELFLWSWT